MSSTKRLNSLLSSSGTLVRKQDGKFLLYNTNPKLVSQGLLFSDLSSVEKTLLQYIRYLQTNGVHSLADFSESGQLKGVAYTLANNTVDENSAYFINKSAALSSISRVNLLISARTLEERAKCSASLREISSSITDSDRKRYLKLKKIALTHLSTNKE